MTTLVHTAYRNFIRNLKRYRILLVALVLISAVLTIVLSVVLGMREGLYEKASRYFAGNIAILGYDGKGESKIEDQDTILKAIDQLRNKGFEIKAVSKRSTYYRTSDIELFYSGYYFNQRRIIGLEWSLERSVLNDFNFITGSVPEDNDETAVLISTTTAENLHIDIGDELLVSIKTDRGRTNTIKLVVNGIFSESSFFGFALYMHRKTLNRLREVTEYSINEIGLYLEKPIKNRDKATVFLKNELKDSLPFFGIIQTREDLENEYWEKRDFLEYGIITVGAQLKEIEDLMGAITSIAGVIILMFLAIVIVGVSNTFTMIVWERTQEIGTLRAMGMQRYRAVLSFMFEAAFLGLGGVIIGLIFGVGILEGGRQGFQFPPNLVTTLFLTKGRIHWVLPTWGVISISALIIGACIFGSLRAAVRAGRLPPVDALRQHE